jgi:hypothetical protein
LPSGWILDIIVYFEADVEGLPDAGKPIKWYNPHVKGRRHE